MADRLPLPEGCTVRLIDLEYGIGGLLAEGADGSINIYLNARLPQAARERALQHELEHYYRGDLDSAADIREIERAADAASGTVPAGSLRAIDGSPLPHPAPVFDCQALRPVGRGLYLPEGGNLEKARADLLALSTPFDEACRVFDVMQRAPLLPIERLRTACHAPGPGDIAFIAWSPAGSATLLPVVLHFCRDGVDPDWHLHGAIYYDAHGAMQAATAACELIHGGLEHGVTFDLRRTPGRSGLRVCAIHREIDGAGFERIYG